ncbi:hypothetical protein SGLAM104S_03407 [Streptomyces glaucescens]
MSESWRWMRPWERRERLVNIALTLPRSQGLLGGEADRLAVHVVEGRGHAADLVPGAHADRLDGGVDVLRVRPRRAA